MEILRWILGGLSGLAFVWLASLNWRVFWLRHVRGVEAPSWIPLLAGLLGAGALFLLPLDASGFWWVPLLVDWGSAPGIVYSIGWLAFRRS